MNDARYTLADGKSVFTSDFLRTRGSCCKSGCLHCPYAFTLNTFGIEFHQNHDQDFIDTVLKDNGEGTDYASRMLQQNLGAKKSFDISIYNDDQIYTMTIKDTPCGILIVEDFKMIKYFLEAHFMGQGITDLRIEEALKNRQ